MAKVKAAEIETNLTYIKDDEEIQFDVDKAKKKLDTLVLEQQVIRYVYCVHDKDTYSKQEEAKGLGEYGKKKKPHIHIFLQLKTPRTFEDVGKWFGVAPNFVNKCGRGRNGKGEEKKEQFENACLYAVHANAPDKYQYPISAAVASAGFDYEEHVSKAREKYQKNQEQKKSDRRKNEIIEKIASGEITKLNMSKYITAVEEVNYNRAIKIALERRERDLILQPDRKMECVYIIGKAGEGKTTLAKLLGEINGFNVGLSGSVRDPVQYYMGQECYIMDDLDPTDFQFKEFIKIIDNNSASAVGSRNTDKIFNSCKLMIMANTIHPKEFATSMKNSQGEDLTQFYRRFKRLIHFVDDDLIITYVYDKTLKDYVKVDEKNNLTKLFAAYMDEHSSEEENKINFSLDDAFNWLFEKAKIPMLDLRKYDIVDGVRVAVRSEPMPTAEESTTTEIPDGLEEVAPAEDLFDWI